MMRMPEARPAPKRSAATALLVALLLAPSWASAKTVIKIATLAPQGSIWMRYFNKLKVKVKKETGGAVALRFYAGGVHGDERDMVRKMRTGQIHGAAVTAIGLAMLNPEVLVLQMPTMFTTYAKIDKARNALADQLEQSFLKRGYVLAGWSEVGPLHTFSAYPIKNLADLKKRRVWVWSDDPISKAMMRRLGVKPRLLGVPAVYPALNTGMVDTVNTSPYACMALQWHSKLKYMSPEPWAIGVAALVVTKKIIDKVRKQNSAHADLIVKLSRAYSRALLRRIRRDNDKARKALLAGGMKLLPKTSNSDRKRYERAAKQVARSFAGRYYSKALLKKVQGLR